MPACKSPDRHMRIRASLPVLGAKKNRTAHTSYIGYAMRFWKTVVNLSRIHIPRKPAGRVVPIGDPRITNRKTRAAPGAAAKSHLQWSHEKHHHAGIDADRPRVRVLEQFVSRKRHQSFRQAQRRNIVQRHGLQPAVRVLLRHLDGIRRRHAVLHQEHHAARLVHLHS